MSATQARPTTASYRDAVTALVKAEEPFSAISEAIDEIADLTRIQKAALRRFAFSLQIRAGSAWAPRWSSSASAGRAVR